MSQEQSEPVSLKQTDQREKESWIQMWSFRVLLLQNTLDLHLAALSIIKLRMVCADISPPSR